MEIACVRGRGGRLVIHVLSSGESSRFCAVSPARALDVSGGFTLPDGGFRSDAFLDGKSFSRRDGTPAVTVQVAAIWAVTEAGSVVLAGRTRSRSQWVLWASSGDVESVLGRIIQRTTRACIMGLMETARSEERKAGIVELELREMMKRLQSGILTGITEEKIPRF
jgi:hypothetical protein